MHSDHSELEAAFAKAIELEGDARLAFVKQVEEENSALAERLRALLRADAQGGQTIQNSIADAITELSDEFLDPWIGQSVGPYTIKKRIGAGGMGAVFLADRADDTFAKSVAVKIMSTQLLGSASIDRFKNERRILASLDHPNIATLIDGGSTEDRVPYLIMQYIDGVSIDTYCQDNRLTIRERIKLFQTVCLAVDYAHRNLIVHRDLKPSNILVDHDGVPHLLDFGIARLVDQDAYGQSDLTAAHGRVLTLDYASPEQIMGKQISVASDVYSLGVLLFRLLAGYSPYNSKTSDPRDLELVILEQPPTKPSSITTQSNRVSTSQVADHVASTRSQSPQKLQQELRGDLDNIVLKCLQKEPERRYSSARSLRDDLERFLRNEPVEAHGEDWFYNLRKFVVRQAKPLAAAAVVLIGAVGLNTYYTAQLAGERNQALQAAAQSREVSMFLTDLFESASPRAAQGEEVTATDLLDIGVERISLLEDQPIVQSELLRVMGLSHSYIGDREQSIDLLEESVELLTQQANADPHRLAETVMLYASALRLASRVDEAEVQARRALTLYQEGAVDDRVLLGRTLGELGSILNVLGRFDEAAGYLSDARQQLEADGREPDNHLLTVTADYGATLSYLGRTREALEIERQVTALTDRVIGPLHPDTIIRHANLAVTFMRAAEYPLADKYAQIAVERGQQVWTTENPQLMTNMALACFTANGMGRFDEAVKLCRGAMELLEGSQWEGTRHDFLAQRTLGVVLVNSGDPAGGYEILEPVLDLATSIFGDENYLTYAAKWAQGDALAAMGRMVEAEPKLRSVVDNRDNLPPTITAGAQKSLMTLKSKAGEYEEAEALLLPLLEASDAGASNDGSVRILLLTDASAHYRRTSDLSRALSLSEEAIAWGEERYAEDHYMIARARGERALVLAAQGDAIAAQSEADKARAVLRRIFPADDEQIRALEGLLQK